MQLTIVIILGLLFGSFFSVVKARVANPKEIVFSRSKCPKCQAILGVLELVPILSYVFLRGRCRKCKKPISITYLAFEIASTLLAILVFYHFGFTLVALTCFLSLGFFLVGAIIDAESREVELYLILTGIGLALIFALLKGHSINGLKNILFGLVSAGILPFLLFAISKEKWMGLGDTFFAIWAGIIVFFPGSIVMIFLSFLLGAIYGMINKNLSGRNAHIAFSPFILIATIFVLIFGNGLVDWYLKILGF